MTAGEYVQIVVSDTGDGMDREVLSHILTAAFPAVESPAAPGKGERILLVEDDESVRRFTQAVLCGRGYAVTAVPGPMEALPVMESQSTRVALLVTDVVMPQMSGRELAERLTRSWPGLRVLYLSGYTQDVIVHHRVFDSGIDFLQKPYRVNELLLKVREILDRPS